MGGDNKYWLCKHCHVGGHHNTALFASESTTSIIECPVGYTPCVVGFILMGHGNVTPAVIMIYWTRCTAEYRVAEYFAVLNRCEPWPVLEPFSSCALSDIAFCFECASKHNKHNCSEHIRLFCRWGAVYHQNLEQEMLQGVK